jgi:outer membrane protein OmpA-like peptidoglycan-associated protein
MKTYQSTERRLTMNISTTRVLCAWSLLAAVGCAHSPPKELVDARAAYQQAASGVAQQQAPAQLHVANSALKRAEQSFDEDGDSEQTRDFAYVALRKAQFAQVQSRIQESERRLTQLESSMSEQTKRELEKLRGKMQTQEQRLEASQAALEEAKKRAEEAKKRAEQATADLARIASIKQEPRGTIITLSGEVLFTSGKAELLPIAQDRLAEVAKALTQQDKTANIVVEGYTDSQGNDSFNLDLSTRRAQAVRDFLASHGVAQDRIRAEGLGEKLPIGDNSTPQGRANNRRVEIVVQPPEGAAQATAS